MVRARAGMIFASKLLFVRISMFLYHMRWLQWCIIYRYKVSLWFVSYILNMVHGMSKTHYLKNNSPINLFFAEISGDSLFLIFIKLFWFWLFWLELFHLLVFLKTCLEVWTVFLAMTGTGLGFESIKRPGLDRTWIRLGPRSIKKGWD